MKRTFYIAGLVSLLCWTLGCAEEYESYIEGVVRSESNNTNPTFPVQGDLAETGGDWYGFCTYNEDSSTFTFEVGHDDKAHLSGDKQFYLLVANVTGPAQEGVWEDPTATVYIDDAKRKTTFERLVFTNVHDWFIDDTVPDAYEKCSVELFSEPGTGEHTPSLHEFEWFVRIVCDHLTGLQDSTGSVTLAGIEANLYFERCD